MARRGPKTLIERYMTEVAEIQSEKGTFIIIYSPRGRYIPKDYYRKLKELSQVFKIERPAKGVIMCYDLKVAQLLLKLTKHYCPDVRLFKAGEVTS